MICRDGIYVYIFLHVFRLPGVHKSCHSYFHLGCGQDVELFLVALVRCDSSVLPYIVVLLVPSICVGVSRCILFVRYALLCVMSHVFGVVEWRRAVCVCVGRLLFLYYAQIFRYFTSLFVLVWCLLVCPGIYYLVL
jgi:hypothetical protein